MRSSLKVVDDFIIVAPKRRAQRGKVETRAAQEYLERKFQGFREIASIGPSCA